MTPAFHSDTTAPPMPNRSLWTTAVFCAAVPLVLGVLVFVLWLATRSPAWALFGFLVVLAGLFAFICGTVCLIILTWQVLRASRGQRPAWAWWIVLAACLLLLNFPAAALIITIVDRIENRFTVVVTNASSTAARDVRVTYDRRTYSAGDLAPGASVARSIHASGAGPVIVSADRGGRSISCTLATYVDADAARGLTLRAQIDDGFVQPAR